MSPPASNWLILLTNFSISTNSVEPDQTAQKTSLIWVLTDLNISADEKADNFCCDWRFEG